MSEHTQGRLTLGEYGGVLTQSGERLEVRGVALPTLYSDHSDEGGKNARRLVACWNALLDAPTDLLEQAASAGITDVSMGNLFSSRLKLQMRRDELLAALKDMLPGAEAMGWNTDKAHAAIAKVEGEPK